MTKRLRDEKEDLKASPSWPLGQSSAFAGHTQRPSDPRRTAATARAPAEFTAENMFEIDRDKEIDRETEMGMGAFFL